MINQRIGSERKYHTSDFSFVEYNEDAKWGLKDPRSWIGVDFDFVIRTAGGGRVKTGKELGAVWKKGNIPDLNMGLSPVKAHVEGVFERFQTINCNEVMWFSNHPFMSTKDIIEWYVKKYK